MAEQELINTNQELSNFPNHVALVMDGNGRWAKARGLPRVQGHHRGAERLRDIVKSCPELGIRYLTVFAFSTENWKRGEDEVSGLTKLFRQYMGSESRELIEKGVKINFIGNREAFDRSLVEQMNQLESTTKNNEVLELTVAINYGGKSEIVDMVRK
ncbi:MAG: di-trans,poly-cis-decaprenylcistransferase, partial [Rhodobacteraceae bacterium]|nr:di-trans,poly-cis-decaprenylcistransferase [Paracoccaceae bacterium]